MHPLIYRIALQVESHAGRAMLVGGCVRDQVVGVEPKDFDMEVSGIAESEIESVLRGIPAHVVLCAGRNGFPVWKVWDESMDQGSAIDVALPRREAKLGEKIVLDPSMDFADGAKHRDFTINSIGLDPLTGEYFDPCGGVEDLLAARLRHISIHFADDPLRVLRGAQFCGRFGLRADVGTVALCSQLSLAGVPRERVWEEWKKLILRSVSPSNALNFLSETGWTRFFPELDALHGVQQHPDWHPEGDVWAHTNHCMDAFAATRTGNDEEDLIVGLAVLCHDMGKPATTRLEGGRWTAHGHEEAGEAPARAFLSRLTADASLIEGVVRLVTNHMVPKTLFKSYKAGQNCDRALRRLATRVRLDRLARVCWCDSAGRPPKPRESADSVWLLAEADRLAVRTSRPKPLILGRDLIERGQRPGPHFGPVLQSAYEAQLDGSVATKEQAVAFALQKLAVAC